MSEKELVSNRKLIGEWGEGVLFQKIGMIEGRDGGREGGNGLANEVSNSDPLELYFCSYKWPIKKFEERLKICRCEVQNVF